MAQVGAKLPAFGDQENTFPMDLSRPSSVQSSLPKTDEGDFVDNMKSSERLDKMKRLPLKQAQQNTISSKRSRITNPGAFVEESVTDRLPKLDTFCEDCQISLTSLTSLIEHQNGKKHLAVVSGKAKPKEHPLPDGPAESKKFDSIKSSECNSEDDTGCQFVRRIPDASKRSTMFSPLVNYFCHLCNVPLPDTSSISLHVKGKKHQSLLRAFSSDQCGRRALQPTDRPESRTSEITLNPLPPLPCPSPPMSPTVQSRSDDCRQNFVENWVSDAIAPHSSNSLGPLNELDVRTVLRRVCLTQISALLGTSQEPCQSTSLSFEQLLAGISAKCNEILCSPTDENCSSPSFPAPLDKLIQNNLLLSWCQLLASL